MRKFILTLLLTLLFLFAYPQSNLTNRDSLKLFLTNTLSIIQQNSLYKTYVDWSSLKTKLFNHIDTVQSYEDLIPRIRYIFQTIGDNHGALILKGKWIGKNEKPPITIRKPLEDQLRKGVPKLKIKVFEKKFGYILIPGNNIGDNTETIAQAIQDSFCNLNSRSLKGIIVDLRLNKGGNVFPMLVGLHQLIGNGMISTLVDENNKIKDKWFLKNGSYYQDSTKVAIVKSKCGISQNLKVVVLLSQITASAGEDLAIAFRGRPNTMFIGEKTYGLTTANSTYKINGEILVLSTSFLADRKGNIYKDGVKPDITIVEGDNFDDLQQDMKIQKAIKWFMNN